MILTVQEKVGCNFWFGATATHWIHSVQKIVSGFLFIVMTEFSLKRVIQKQIVKTELSLVLMKLSNIFWKWYGEGNDFMSLLELFHSCEQWEKMCY